MSHKQRGAVASLAHSAMTFYQHLVRRRAQPASIWISRSDQIRGKPGAAMALLTLGGDVTVQHVECREQRDCAGAFTVVCHGGRPFLIGGPGCAVQRLYPSLLVAARQQGVLGRQQTQPNDVFELVDDLGIA